jgi:predicted RND superfamily exporter protein
MDKEQIEQIIEEYIKQNLTVNVTTKFVEAEFGNYVDTNVEVSLNGNTFYYSYS